MPRKRPPGQPPRERTKLGTVAEINVEIRKLYRRYANGEISETSLKARVATLAALRGGLSDPVEKTDDEFGPGIEQLNLVGIPRNWFVVGLLGADAHLPAETIDKLQELLPQGSLHRPPSLDAHLPPPPEPPPSRPIPMLKLFESELAAPEPSPAA